MNAYKIEMRDESMSGLGIHDGDMLKIDISAEIKTGDVAVVVINGEQAALRKVEFYGDMVNLIAVGSRKPRVQQYKKSDVDLQGKFIGVSKCTDGKA